MPLWQRTGDDSNMSICTWRRTRHATHNSIGPVPDRRHSPGGIGRHLFLQPVLRILGDPRHDDSDLESADYSHQRIWYDGDVHTESTYMLTRSFPTSRMRSSAKPSACCSMSAPKATRASSRWSQVFALHTGKARSAAAMVSSSCSLVATGTCAKVSPVTGLMIGAVVGEVAGLPSIIWVLKA